MMRIAFMGTPDFAVPALRALHAAGHSIVAVYCQPPRPAGRGQSLRRCPVQQAAEALGLFVRTPEKLRRNEAEQTAFAALHLDACIVAAYGLILPQPMLDAPIRGCLNIHASLLPRWRGAAPIQAAILAGDQESGITVMQMEASLDTGPMLLQARIPIIPTTTAAILHDALAELGASLILQALAENPPAIPQPDEGANYAPKLTREDGRIDWTETAESLDRKIRALNPWPGTFTTLDSEPLKILEAIPVPGNGPPGALNGDIVTAGQGALRLTKVQAPGRAAMPAADYLRGRRLPPGTLLG